MSRPLKSYIPDTKWSAWASLPRRERFLLSLAYLCDTYSVREDRGNNRGEIIDAMATEAGYSKGLAWCAIALSSCAILAGYEKRELPLGYGAVRNWRNWAVERGYITKRPGRGDLAFWVNRDGTGHIEAVVSAGAIWVNTIGGNTSSGEAGSQRDGDGLYRRKRLRATFHGFIRLPE
jgi:hypothetical protein